MESVLDEMIEKLRKNPKRGITVKPNGAIVIAITGRSNRSWDFMHGGWIMNKRVGSWDLRFHA